MIIPLIIGAVAIFIWSQLSPKKPVEKTEVLESPLPEPKIDIIDIFKKNAPKVVAIVTGGGAALAAGGGAAAAGGGAAAAAGGAAAAATVGAGIAAAVIPLTALPAATVLPAGLAAMAPTTLTSAVYTAPAVVGTGTGSSSIGAGVGGSSGVGAAIGGAAMVASPLIIVPLIAKFLDSLSGPKKSLQNNPELAAEQARITEEKMELVSKYVPGSADPSYSSKSGFSEGEGT